MKITSWNVQGRLTLITKKRRGTPKKILDMIEGLDADVLVLPEAYISQPNAGVNERLRKMGYEWRDARYDEHASEHRDDNYIRVLSRYKILESEQLRWNDDRGLLSVIIQDPKSRQKIRFIATHLDERSDRRRLAQLNDAVPFINSNNLPTVMLGDFNAMHLDRRSRLLRTGLVKLIISFMPIEQLKELGRMLVEMASGSSLKLIETATNLRDIDTKHHPTTTPKIREMEWLPGIRIAQIDHIFVSPEINASNFKIAQDGGSDHRAISAEISLKL